MVKQTAFRKICSVIFSGTEVGVTRQLHIDVFCSFFLFSKVVVTVAFCSHQKDLPIATIFQRCKEWPQNDISLFPAIHRPV